MLLNYLRFFCETDCSDVNILCYSEFPAPFVDGFITALGAVR